jgi:hypothetical protein
MVCHRERVAIAIDLKYMTAKITGKYFHHWHGGDLPSVTNGAWIRFVEAEIPIRPI